jgi:hypothetical protein
MFATRVVFPAKGFGKTIPRLFNSERLMIPVLTERTRVSLPGRETLSLVLRFVAFTLSTLSAAPEAVNVMLRYCPERSIELSIQKQKIVGFNILKKIC